MERDQGDFSAAAASALLWWTEAGVDCLVAESPRDWLRAPPAEPSVPAPKAPTSAPAPAAGALPDSLDLFRALLADDPTLPFAAAGAPRVGPSGDAASGLMILTDMPSPADCADGLLLSGEEGRLFDRMLAAIGRDRASAYLAPLSCLRSPDGRLSADALRECAALARHHIELAAPRALLLFGEACSKALLGLPLAHARGRVHEIGAVRAVATIAPRELLKRPAHKAYAWADLKLLIEGPK